MNKHLLVVGAGFLGKEIVREAVAAGWLVSVLSRSATGDRCYAADVSDVSSFMELSKELSPTHIVHCASASSGSADRLTSYKKVYLEGSKNLTKVFPNSRVLFTSSTSVYAQQDGSVVDESAETNPSTEAGKVLLEAEKVILKAGGNVARLSGIYGNGRSYMLKQLRAGIASLDGSGSRLLNHIHHVDGARACLSILERAAASEVFNVSDSVTLSQKETYDKLCQSLSRPFLQSGASTKRESTRGVSDKSISNKKLLNLGWEPLFPCFADAAPHLEMR